MNIFRTGCAFSWGQLAIQPSHTLEQHCSIEYMYPVGSWALGLQAPVMAHKTFRSLVEEVYCLSSGEAGMCWCSLPPHAPACVFVK